jgi:exodeoxyribonuclease VII small subunit
MTEKSRSLEASMERLEAIVAELEKGEHTLEESLKRFEEGLKLGKHCRRILDKAEMRIRKLVGVDEEGNPVEEDFDDEG